MGAELIGPAIAFGFDLVTRTLAYLEKLRAAAQQSGEWTPEQETAFKEQKKRLYASPAWQVEP